MATAVMDWVSTGQRKANKLARRIGWMSIGLGVTELVAPGAIKKFTGISRGPIETRISGAKKIAAGVGIMRHPARAVNSLVQLGGGIAALAGVRRLLPERESRKSRKLWTAAAIAGGTVVGAICVKKLIANGNSAGSLRHSSSSAMNVSAEQCYNFWRDQQNLPKAFSHLKSVRDLGNGRTEWVAQGMAGKDFAWTMETIEDVPNQQIEWRSTGESACDMAGSVRFEPLSNGKGVIVRAHMQYEVPAGASVWLGKLLGSDPGLSLRKALMRSKQLLETGEIATTEGQPAGRPQSTTALDRMARV